jgi:hypothetical protein
MTGLCQWEKIATQNVCVGRVAQVVVSLRPWVQTPIWKKRKSVPCIIIFSLCTCNIRFFKAMLKFSHIIIVKASLHLTTWMLFKYISYFLEILTCLKILPLNVEVKFMLPKITYFIVCIHYSYNTVQVLLLSSST